MKNKLSLPLVFFLFATPFLPMPSWADDGIVRLYAGPATTNYSMDFGGSNPSFLRTNKIAHARYTATNFGLTYAAANGYYVDISAQQSGSAHHDAWEAYTTQTESFSHTSYVLTGGYNRVFESGGNMAYFGGYNSGKTTMNAPKGAVVFPGPFGTIGWSKDVFDSKGIFFGIGGGFPALGGRIGASAAAAYMSGTWTDDNGLNNSADSTWGYSFSANYTYKFNSAWGMIADWKYQMYNYNFHQTVTTYTVKEFISSLGVRLSYQF